jgi:hypothetical protein
VGTTLTIEPPIPVSVGNPAFIVLKLISSKGEPVVDQPIELFVNDVRERRARTDATGTATVRVTSDEAGVYALSAVFKGSKSPSLGSSRAAADLVVSPATVEIIVTPPLPDIRFSLDGKVFASDDYGLPALRFQVHFPAGYSSVEKRTNIKMHLAAGVMMNFYQPPNDSPETTRSWFREVIRSADVRGSRLPAVTLAHYFDHLQGSNGPPSVRETGLAPSGDYPSE